MRCLALAHEFKRHGLDIFFICRKHDGDLISFIEDQKGFNVFSLSKPTDFLSASRLGVSWKQDAEETLSIIKKKGGPLVLVVDHYGIDSRWHNALKACTKKILVIDDLADRFLDCDFLLNQTYGCKVDQYRNLVPNHCTLMLGASYALLQNQFTQHRAAAENRRKTSRGIERVFVSMGGTDYQNVTRNVLIGLEKVDWRHTPEIDVVLSSRAPFINEVKEFALRSLMHIRVLVDAGNMAELMLNADLAIGAGGTTAWERCCLGLPSIVILTAENQKEVVESLVVSGAAISLGEYNDFTPELLCKQINQLHNQNNGQRILSLMSSKAFGLCDGIGVQRVARKLMAGSLDVFLRPAAEKDCKMVFKWQTFPGIRRYCRYSNPPEWMEHRRWFEKTLDDLNCRLFVIMYGSDPAGIIRLDNVEPRSEGVEVSILIAPACQGKGIAKKALCVLRKSNPAIKLIAEIFPENIVSVKLFTSAGYQMINDTWFVNNPEK